MQNMSVKDVLKENRKTQKMTQADLAKKAGLSVNSVQRYESGERIPHVPELIKLAHALDLTLSDFLEDNNAMIDMGDGIKHPVGVAYWVSDEEDLLNNYRRLNEDGKGKVRKYTEDLAGNPKYKAAPEDE